MKILIYCDIENHDISAGARDNPVITTERIKTQYTLCCLLLMRIPVDIQYTLLSDDSLHLYRGRSLGRNASLFQTCANPNGFAWYETSVSRGFHLGLGETKVGRNMILVSHRVSVPFCTG